MLRPSVHTAQWCTAMAFVLGITTAAHASTPIMLAWDPSPDPRVVGYVVSYGTVPGEYPNFLDVGNATTANVDNVQAGEAYYFTVEAYTASGLFSAPSNIVADSVPKATPTIIWPTPADLVYGAALGATQLNATASVPGTFVYTPATGTVLNAGAAQTLSVTFTPTDTANYTTATQTVAINVAKATPTLHSPSGKIGTNAPTFTWNTVSSATAYYLLVQDSSGTAVLQRSYGSAVCGVSTCSVTPSLALSRGTYRWSVQTWSSSGYGSPSSPLTFLFGLSTLGDFDGDGKADNTVFRPSTGTWYVLGTSASATCVWGGVGDIPVAGDYDGDGKTDIAVFRPSTGAWYIILSSTGIGFSYTWGGAGDIPVPGDYDGDGKTDIAVFRPSTGVWYIIKSSTSIGSSSTWGGAGDIPVPGDYDGDGKTDIAVFRPSTGVWYIIRSSTSIGSSYTWGGAGDIPVPGDYDGDGKTDIAVFRPSTGVWYIIRSSTSIGSSYTWGGAGDIPVPGDYDGDGKTDIAVFRPSTGTWYIVPSSTMTGEVVTWGGAGDIPILKR